MNEGLTLAPCGRDRYLALVTMNLDPDAALVLLSGGQDSGTCLAWALGRYARVETVGFDYGQRHAVELEARLALRQAIGGTPAFAGRLGPDHLLPLGTFAAIGATAMTEAIAFGTGTDGLPNTFVPGRNLAFLALAGALAYRRDLGVLVGGMCQADGSGYPDCRADAIRAQETALRAGLDADLTIETPLMDRTKAQSWELAEEIGGAALVETIRTLSHTCYVGERGTLHDWGYGCGVCPACTIRAAGWQAYEARRP